MTNFKKQSLLIGAVLCLSFLAWGVPAAQAQSGPGGKVARALNLTDDQKAQLKPLLSNARQQLLSIRNDSTLTLDQKRQKVQVLRAQFRTELDQILSPAQQQELTALRAKFRQQRMAQQQLNQQPQAQ